MNPIPTCLAALGTSALLAACHEQQHAEAPASRHVLSVLVAAQTGRTLSFAGTVEPRYRSDLGFRVLGRVISRNVNVGDMVKKGQLLAALDPVSFQLAVQSAQADLASAVARVENASATEERQRTLLQQSVASQAQFDAAKEARETAEASLIRVKADLDKVQEQLGYTELRADFDGVVTAITAEVGQVIQPGQTVVALARPDIREALIDLPASIGRGLRPGARFDIALQASPAVRTGGTVREIAPQADPTTRTQRVRVSLDGPAEDFRLGTTITAMVPPQATPLIELPASALLDRNGTTMVWVVDPAAKSVSTREVKVAARDGASVRVQDGLTAGTRVVIAGVNSLAPGQTIKLAEDVSQ